MFPIFLFAYSLLYTLGLLLYFPVLLFQAATRGRRTVLTPRLGLEEAFRRLAPPGDRLRVWVHAVSVGELNAVRPLIRTLIADGCDLVVSTTTRTGRRLADDQFGRQAQVLYFPLDSAWICRRYLRRIAPRAIIIAETELWPNFIVQAHRRRIPLLLVNGRLSDPSFRNYRRLPAFFSPLLRQVSHFCMQTRADKERVLALGAPEERVNWVGNLKYDYTPAASDEPDDLSDRIRRWLQPQAEPVWLCGSTKPGEELLLIPVYRRLKERFPDLKLLLAPRHPHRAAEVARLLREQGLSFGLRSQLDHPAPVPAPVDVLVLDSVGELARLYSLAEVVFIGGSLVPTGGQNIIEPAAFAKPILFGPHMDNFREIALSFTEAYAALQVDSADDLQARLGDLLADPHAREWLGRNARKVIRANQGALDRTLEILRRYLPASGGAA